MKKNNANQNLAKRSKKQIDTPKKNEIKVNKIIKTTDAKKITATEEPTKKKPSKARKIITIILLILVLAMIAGVVGVLIWGNDLIAKITGGNGNIFEAITFLTEEYDDLKTDENGRTNILVFGTSGYDMDGSEGDGTHAGAQLTDSIMVVSLDQKTGDMAMLNLPRDLKMTKTCTATGKVNEIYWCNNMSNEDENAGATAMMEEIGEILGVDFQYYAHINWESLVEIVNALGGINVTLDEDINDYYYTGAVYQAGIEYTLNGEEALGLARARHGTTGGDFSRGNSQQKILIGIKDKIYEENVSLMEMINLFSALGDNLRTNFSIAEIKTLAHLTFEFDFDKIRQVALVDYDNDIYLMTTGTINGISYVLPSAGAGNYSKIRAYVKENLLTEPVTEDETEDETNGEESETLSE